MSTLNVLYIIHSSNLIKLSLCIVYRKQVCLTHIRVCYTNAQAHGQCAYILMASAAVKISNIPTADNRHLPETLCVCDCVRVCAVCFNVRNFTCRPMAVLCCQL